MSEALIPAIHEVDIAWACGVMGLPEGAFSPIDGDDSRLIALQNLETADFEACPGSGKTTLLVTKLAILANKWVEQRCGLCVLSHTNAARNEISSRLSSCTAGNALLRYPHFVGTIHAFVNEFLAIPWLRSKGIHIKAIDNDLTLDKRWHALPYNTRSYLEKQNLNKYALSYDQPDFGGGQKGSIGVNTQTYQTLARISRESSLAGYFCYDEMFVWAFELLDSYPEIVQSMRSRFPLVLVDEAQDNSELQSTLLSRLFCAGGNSSRRQRFGDSNQAIYQYAGQSGATTDSFPGAVVQDLPRSYRFGQAIADHAKPLGVAPQPLVGAGPSQALVARESKTPAILLFDDATVGAVLPKYAELLIETFTAQELAKGVYAAVAAVHNSDRVSPVPFSMSHYAPGYDPVCARKEAAPNTFSQFLVRARFKMDGHGDVFPLVTGTAEAVLHLSGLYGGDTLPMARRKSPHRRVQELLDGKDALACYEALVALVIERRGDLSSTDWETVGQRLAVATASAIADTKETPSGVGEFIRWTATDSAAQMSKASLARTSNLFSYPAEDPKVHIRLGSIHAVKGETHTATLVLDSFFHDHHLLQLKPWLLGVRSGGKKGNKSEGSRMLGRLKLHYVAMTRPSHMLCLAMRRDSFDTSELDSLRERGWHVVDCL